MPRTLFNRQLFLFKTRQLQTEFSNLYYFLPSITERSAPVNKHVNSLNLTTIHIPEKKFEVDRIWPVQVRYHVWREKVNDRGCIENVKKTADISYSSLVKNGLRMDFCRKNLLKWRLSGVANLRQARFVRSIRCSIDLFLQTPTHITICLQTLGR